MFCTDIQKIYQGTARIRIQTQIGVDFVKKSWNEEESNRRLGCPPAAYRSWGTINPSFLRELNDKWGCPVHVVTKSPNTTALLKVRYRNQQVFGVRSLNTRNSLFSDSDDLDDEHIVMNEKCCPVFPDAKTVSRRILRAILDFYHITPQVRTCGKPFQSKLDPNAEVPGDRCQVFFRPS